MAEAPIWPVATDALISDTVHLSDAEFGAYMRLMIAQWRNKGQPLDFPPEKLARICGTPKRQWQARWEAISDLFDDSKSPSLVSQKRVADDYAEVAAKIAQARKAGARGGNAKSRKTKGRHIATATNPPVAENKRPSSDRYQSASSGMPSEDVAKSYQSINHKEEDTLGSLRSPKDAAASKSRDDELDIPAFLDRRRKPDETEDPDKRLYRLGRELLGPKSGGMITRLKQAKGGSIPDALAAIEAAATKHDPAEYIGAMISKPKQDARPFAERYPNFMDEDTDGWFKRLVQSWAPEGALWPDSIYGPSPAEPETRVHKAAMDRYRERFGDTNPGHIHPEPRSATA